MTAQVMEDHIKVQGEAGYGCEGVLSVHGVHGGAWRCMEQLHQKSWNEGSMTLKNMDLNDQQG